MIGKQVIHRPILETFLYRTILINTPNHMIKIFSGNWEEIYYSFEIIKIWASFSHVIDLCNRSILPMLGCCLSGFMLLKQNATDC